MFNHYKGKDITEDGNDNEGNRTYVINYINSKTSIF